MSVLHEIEGYDDQVISICPDGTKGEIIEILNELADSNIILDTERALVALAKIEMEVA